MLSLGKEAMRGSQSYSPTLLIHEWIMITHMLIVGGHYLCVPFKPKPTNFFLFFINLFFLFFIINLWMASLFITLYDVDPLSFCNVPHFLCFFFLFLFLYIFVSFCRLINFSYHGCQKEITMSTRTMKSSPRKRDMHK